MNYLNAKQIIRFATVMIHDNSKYSRLLWLVREYAKYFPAAKITVHQINSPKALHDYMYGHGIDLSVPTAIRK